MSAIHRLPVDAGHVLRLYARLAAVSASIRAHAVLGEWEQVAELQYALVEVTEEMKRVEESAETLDPEQKTSRILYLTAALADQQEATECLMLQSAAAKKEAASLHASERLRRLVNSPSD